MYNDDGKLDVPHREWLIDFQQILDDVKENLKAQGRQDDFIGAKVCLHTDSFK